MVKQEARDVPNFVGRKATEIPGGHCQAVREGSRAFALCSGDNIPAAAEGDLPKGWRWGSVGPRAAGWGATVRSSDGRGPFPWGERSEMRGGVLWVLEVVLRVLVWQWLGLGLAARRRRWGCAGGGRLRISGVCWGRRLRLGGGGCCSGCWKRNREAW